MSTSSVGHRPNGPRWEFDADVTNVFEDMLARSIPGYSEMRRVVTEVGRRFVQPGTAVVDLGCSRGAALEPFVGDAVAGTFVGVEVSEPMRVAAAARFANVPNVEILDLDLRESYPNYPASLTLSVLTVQFTPIEYRHRIIADVYKNTLPGGALIIVEKCLGNTPEGNELLVETYLERKAAAGYSTDDIEDKRKALEGVLVPITPDWNEALLRSCGFTTVEPIWRVLNFAAWVAVRGPQ